MMLISGRTAKNGLGKSPFHLRWKTRKTVYRSLISVFVLGFLSLTSRAIAAEQKPVVLKPEGDVEHTHDPSIAKDGNTWYVFGTNNGPERTGEITNRCWPVFHQWTHVVDVVPP